MLTSKFEEIKMLEEGTFK